MKQHDLGKEPLLPLFFSYAVPGMIVVCVFSLYSLADAAFISRACGPKALAAVGLCAPLLSVFSCLSVVIGVGGNVLAGIALGSGNQGHANRIFSLATCLTAGASALFFLLLTLFPAHAAKLLGADEETLPYVCQYLSVCGWFAPFYLVGGFWSLAVETAGKPSLAMLGNAASALANIALDFLFVIVFKRGIFGASLASGLSAALAVVIFGFGLFQKQSLLRFTKFSPKLRLIGQMLYNGLSEGVSAVSGGLIAFVYNLLIMKSGGADILADFTIAITIINFIGAVLLGASGGLTPIVSFNYGSNNLDRVKRTLSICLCAELLLAGVSAALLVLLHTPLMHLFGTKSTALTWKITLAYLPALFLTPCCVTVISFFTAINDAKTSALLSALRGIIIRITVVLLIFQFAGLNGVWWSCAIAETISAAVCFATLKVKTSVLNSIVIKNCTLFL